MERLALVFSLLLVGTCSAPEYIVVLINATGRTPAVSALGVTLRLNGKLAPQDNIHITDNLDRFVVRLPNTDSSRGVLTVVVAGLSAGGAAVLGGTVPVPIPADPLQLEATLHLDPLRSCSVDQWCWQNPLPQGGQLKGGWAADRADAWASGTGGTMMHWNGQYWTQAPSHSTSDLNGVWGSDSRNVWAVGRGGTILKWDGMNWQPQSSATTSDLYGIWGSDANNLWAVGYNGATGTVLKWNGVSSRNC